jgi:hypothetical protein
MFEQAENEIIERVIRQLRQPVAIDQGLDARVMRQIAADVRPTSSRSRVWLLGWSALAAAAVFTTLLITHPWSPREHVRPDSYQFVLIAPHAASVALVGDFNDWNPARSPMRATNAGIWATVLPLAPGRYHYAFLVNGVEWRRDPAAPAVVDDDFGSPSSVVTVGGGS